MTARREVHRKIFGNDKLTPEQTAEAKKMWDGGSSIKEIKDKLMVDSHLLKMALGVKGGARKVEMEIRRER